MEYDNLSEQDLVVANEKLSAQLKQLHSRVVEYAKQIHAGPNSPTSQEKETLNNLMGELKGIEKQQKSLQEALTKMRAAQAKKPVNTGVKIVASGGMTGYHVAEDLLRLDFNSGDKDQDARSPEEVYRAVSMNADFARLRDGNKEKVVED